MDGERKTVTCKLLKVGNYRPIVNSRNDGQPIVEYVEVNDPKAPMNFILIPETVDPTKVSVLLPKSKLCVTRNIAATEEKSVESNTKVSVPPNLLFKAKNGWTNDHASLIRFQNNSNLCDTSTGLRKTSCGGVISASTEEKSIESSMKLSNSLNLPFKANNKYPNTWLNNNTYFIPVSFDNIINLSDMRRESNDKRSIEEPEVLKNNKRCVCEVCSKTFSQKYNLDRHSLIHTGERPYVCDICGKAFSSSSSLWSHKKTHSTEKPFLCEICGKTFSKKGNLETHLQRHRGEKCYVCSICNNSYVSHCALSKHKKLHCTKGPLFICEICGRKFKLYSQYRLHIRKHKGDKRFSCNFCDKKFLKGLELKQHMRTHTGERPYKCDSCEKTFSARDTLRLHNRQHTGEEPYLCHKCPKTFKSRSNMETHIRTHFGIKPYSCNICNRKFTQTHSLKKHIADKVCLKITNVSEEQNEQYAITCES